MGRYTYNFKCKVKRGGMDKRPFLVAHFDADADAETFRGGSLGII